jgi:hypothetical protein
MTPDEDDERDLTAPPPDSHSDLRRRARTGTADDRGSSAAR